MVYSGEDRGKLKAAYNIQIAVENYYKNAFGDIGKYYNMITQL